MRGDNVLDKPLLIVIAGPTAVGKTKNAIEVGKMLDSEIISADSMQIYKYMDIGTAKPTLEERQGVPHHLIDIIKPNEKFSVADYKKLAETKIKETIKKNKIPILTGGTGLYIKAVIDNYYFPKAAVDTDYRRKLEKEFLEKGGYYLHNILKEKDPVSAAKIHHNDMKRMIRALEVLYQTGKPISYYEKITKQRESPYNLCYFGLTLPREKLYKLINDRVDTMVESGLVEEVKELLKKGYKKDINAFKGLGYKQIIDYIEGKYTLQESIEILKRDTRRFAKRQFTWFNKDSRVKWIDISELSVKDHLYRKDIIPFLK